MGVYQSDQTPDFQTRPVFLYGTLMAAPLLALVLTGNRKNKDVIVPLRNPSTLSQGECLGKDYPALVKGAQHDLVEGMIFYPRNMDDRRKLNNFEGEQYAREIAKVVSESGDQVEASTYVWSGEKAEVTEADWDFKEFESSRLSDWLDLFDGIEFIFPILIIKPPNSNLRHLSLLMLRPSQIAPSFLTQCIHVLEMCIPCGKRN